MDFYRLWRPYGKQRQLVAMIGLTLSLYVSVLFEWLLISTCRLAIKNKTTSFHFQDFLSINKNLTIDEEMALRIETMKQACHHFGLDQPGNDSLHRPYSWEYLIDNKHHLVWCNVFKSGSTRYFVIFNLGITI
jgi:hypothetical protein